MTFGVLAMQGAVEPHRRAIEACGHEAILVRRPAEVAAVAGLIIPGGESTTIGKLIQRFDLDRPIRELAAAGKPVFGTCAGMILLAQEIEESDQFRLGLMDVTVRRNAFGRQVDSFEADLEIEGLENGPFRAVFIRAPYLTEVRGESRPLASVEGKVVMAQQGNLLAAAFHPELTPDLRIHRKFIALAA
ncbi:MAG: pyridoxal 5'-phosphate synthase glutaminase subunit PdxT [Armatimonadota bacterium]